MYFGIKSIDLKAEVVGQFELQVFANSASDSERTCLKGMKLIAGGNAPGEQGFSPDPERVAPLDGLNHTGESLFGTGDPFRVGHLYRLSGGRCPRLLTSSLSGTR